MVLQQEIDISTKVQDKGSKQCKTLMSKSDMNNPDIRPKCLEMHMLEISTSKNNSFTDSARLKCKSRKQYARECSNVKPRHVQKDPIMLKQNNIISRINDVQKETSNQTPLQLVRSTREGRQIEQPTQSLTQVKRKQNLVHTKIISKTDPKKGFTLNSKVFVFKKPQ